METTTDKTTEAPKHTPGRLEARTLAVYAGNELVAHVGGTLGAGPRVDEQVANARRLAACWNACDGITTEALEQGAVRDLLAACKKANTCASLPDAVKELIRAAIAKAEGRQP